MGTLFWISIFRMWGLPEEPFGRAFLIVCLILFVIFDIALVISLFMACITFLLPIIQFFM